MGKQEFFLSGGSEWFFHQLSHASKLDKSPSLRIDSEIDDFILHLDDSKDGDNEESKAAKTKKEPGILEFLIKIANRRSIKLILTMF